MIEVYYPSNSHPKSKLQIKPILEEKNGKITFEEIEENRVTLTVEFDEQNQALESKTKLENLGFHIEGPTNY